MSSGRTAAKARRDSQRRMKWWHDARFGMFIHYGLYSQLGRGEWVMYWDRIPKPKYEKLMRTFQPKPGAISEWVNLARKSGMKYIVLTTKHHDGFCLWDSKVTDYNAARSACGRDLIAEYVKACRKAGMGVGFYYSLLDWHTPDCAAALKNKAAHKRFIKYTYDLVEELMTRYGKIDVLWYDGQWMFPKPEQWGNPELNAMVRRHQPDILINNRSQTPEDFGTPEQRIVADPDRAWESCMTFSSLNVTSGVWGWRPDPIEDWASTRGILDMLRKVTAGGGNMLMNIGPMGDGTVPDIARDRLLDAGKWLRGNEEAIYGKVDRVTNDHFPPWLVQGKWTRKGKVGYLFYRQWVGNELVVPEMVTKVKKVTYLKTGKPVKFTQDRDKIVLKGLPAKNPDKVASITVFKIEFAGTPKWRPNRGHVLPAP